MANRLHRNESATKRLRHIVRKETRLAIEAIERAIACDGTVDGAESAGEAAIDKAVHEARQRLKRARAGLRLLRAALGKNRFERENLTLRDAARPLTEIRDARVLADTFVMLEAGDAASLDPELLAGMDRYLIERRAALWQPSPPDAALEFAASPFPLPSAMFPSARAPCATQHPLVVRLEPALQALKAAHGRAKRWPLDGHGWPAVAQGLERVYRAGRASLALARRNPSVEQLHEWRKQAKYLRYQLEMLEPMQPKALRTLAEQARQIGDYLGDNHDLALLADIARGHFSTAPDAGRLLAIIDHRRDQLASQAGAIGMTLYRRSPKAFVDRLRKPWHAWRDG